jgi:hypothetical protein
MSKKSENRKLAVLLITTHGNLDYSVSLGSDGKKVEGENMIRHDGEINVHKINATREGVCNFISDDHMNEMIQKIALFIRYIYREEYTENNCQDSQKILPDKDKQILCFNGTDKENDRSIINLSKTLRNFMIRIDDVRNETETTAKEYNKKGTFRDRDDLIFEPSDWKDKDLLDYLNSVDETYSLTEWTKNHSFPDKLYTLDPEEKKEEGASGANNTMILLTPGGYEYLLPEFKKTITRSYTAGENYTIRLSEVIQSLKSQGYTDTIIIDLSCNIGTSDTSTRNLQRRKGGRGKKTKKNRKKPSNKKKRQKQKTTRKKKV